MGYGMYSMFHEQHRVEIVCVMFRFQWLMLEPCSGLLIYCLISWRNILCIETTDIPL